MTQLELEVPPTFQDVLDQLNAIRAIVFGPPVGSRLLLDERTRLRLSDHLWRIQDIASRASARGHAPHRKEVT